MNIKGINPLNYIQAIDPDKQNDRFKKGKKFHSRIKNISRDGTVELELEDGLIMEARLGERISAGIGDVALFEITERTDDYIQLKYIKEKGQGKKKFDVRV